MIDGPHLELVQQETPSSDHDITTVKGSARQLDGTPADLIKPMDYPCEALCLECGQPIRCEGWFLDPWRHLERFSTPADR